jgi:hypothetical protein
MVWMEVIGSDVAIAFPMEKVAKKKVENGRR